MMKKLPLLLFLLLACFSTAYGEYFPGERKVSANDIPGLIAQLKNSTVPQKRIDIMLSIGFGYLFKAGETKADMDSAMFYAQEAAALSKQTDNVSFLNESRLLTGMISIENKDREAAKRMLHMVNDSTRLKLLFCISKDYYYNGQKGPGDQTHLDSTVYYGQSAFAIAFKLKKNIYISAVFSWLEFMVNKHTASSEAQSSFLLNYTNKVDNISTVMTLTRLCRLSILTGDLYKALDYAIKAEKALTSNSTDMELYNVNIYLGNVYKLMRDFDKSIFYHQKILADPDRFSPFISLYSIADAYCYCLRWQNRNDEIISFMQKFHQKHPPQTNIDKSHYHLSLALGYHGLNMLSSAEEHYLEAIRYRDSAKESTALLYSYLGTLYNRSNQDEKANISFKIADELLFKDVKNNTAISILANLQFIAKSEARLGNYESAYNHLLKSKTMSDSIYTVSKEKHTQELDFQYQTQKKEADIRLKEENIRYLHQNAELMARDAKLQKAKLKEASLLDGQKETALQLKEKNIENLTNSAKLQQAEITQAEAKRKITALVIILLAVIIALLIWLFWSKLRSNKIITDKNGMLQQLVTEKSWLVKEMHHRLKNNLHTVMSLLESQSAYLQDDALEAVKNSQCRIFSMSLIHQKLYQEDVVKTIDMECYIPELISYLRECFNLPGSFRINMDIDPAAFDVSEAVPLGLIVNEAVTNSLKYSHAGEINISLKAAGINEYELILADNGIGLKEGFDIDKVTSLGFKLIKGLSDQLDAKLNIINKNGLKIKLSGISVYKPAFNKQLTA